MAEDSRLRPLATGSPVALDARALRELDGFLRELLLAAGPPTLEHFRTAVSVDNKHAEPGAFDPVTIADRAAETVIRELIAARYPEHGVYGEEHGYETGSSPLTWVIDPIDGTRAFITGQLHWGVLVALYDGEKPVLGGMYQPYTGELFTGGPSGARAERDGVSRSLQTRECARLDDAVLCCTTPSMFREASELSAFEALAARVRLHRFGGDCYSYCMLAHGLTDLVVEADLKTYDVQALIPVVEGAGGVMTDWQGGSAAHGGQVIAAGDARVHAAALKILSPDEACTDT
jgi:myo-inositol-1(or 4)-monophosphatase